MNKKIFFVPVLSAVILIIFTSTVTELSIFEVTLEQAKLGDAHAQCDLAFMYYEGNGVEQNYTEAVKWFRQAGLVNDDRAQLTLWNMYYYGNGVEQDYGEADEWRTRFLITIINYAYSDDEIREEIWE